MTNEATLFSQAVKHIESKEYIKAEECFLELIKLNNIHAQINLATLYLDPHAGFNKHQEALEMLLDAVNKPQGISAANSLGMIYMTGMGVKADNKTAYKWFTKGADADIAACMVNMGKLNLIGVESAPDLKAAITCFIRSYKHGYPFGLVEVKNLLSTANKKTTKKTIIEDLYECAKLAFISENSTELGKCNGELDYEFAEMLDQVSGFHTFKQYAYDWYRLAHLKGNKLATNNMGGMHLKGEIGGPDFEAAFKFFKQAAENGNAYAMKNLGCCYLEGIGTQENLEFAIHWLKLAVDQSVNEAIPALGFAYYSQAPEETSRYIDLMEKACELQHPESLTILGELYLDGKHVPANTKKAIQLLEKASNLKSSKASLILGVYFAFGSHKPDYAKSQKYLIETLTQTKWEKGHLAIVSEIYYQCHQQKEFGITTAIELNQKLADMGDGAAQARLASLYLEAQDELHDPIQAFKYAYLSAKQKIPLGLSILLAMYVAGNTTDEDLLDEVINELDILSKNGSPESAFALARFYQLGSKHIQQDKHMFMEYLSRAANLGFPPAIAEMKKIPKN